MRHLIALVLVLWSVPALAYQETVAFGEEPMLSVIVEPEHALTGGAYVQGEIVVTIRVSSLYPFEALDVDVPPVEGARTEILLKPRLRKVKSYAGDGYVLERVIALYPQRSGRLVLPPVIARGTVSPNRGEELDFVEKGPEIALEVNGIPAGFDGERWLVSPHIRMEERWSKPVEELRHGDVVRREITLTAMGIPHTRLALPEHGRTRGIAISAGEASGTTERTVDGVIGTLTQSWDLRIGTAQTQYVAPMGLPYWDPVEGRRAKASVRGYRIEPLPADEAAIATALMAEAHEAHSGFRLLGIAAAVVAALPLAGLFLLWLWALMPTRSDLALRQTAARTNDALTFFAAARHWALRSGLALSVLGPQTEEARALSDSLFGADHAATPDLRATARGLTRLARRRRVARLRQRFARITHGLLGTPRKLAQQ